MPDMRKTPGSPVRTIRSFLWTAHRLQISAGAIVEATHRVAQPARPVVADMLERIRESPVVHADETGWREGGANGYVWTFSAPGERYFLRRGRGKAVVDEALGSPSAGCWQATSTPPTTTTPAPSSGAGRVCCGTVRDLNALYPHEAGLARWSRALKRLYLRANSLAARSPVRDHRRLTSPDQLKPEEQLLAPCRPFPSDETAPQARLCRRMERFIKELFVFVSNPDVPPDNKHG